MKEKRDGDRSRTAVCRDVEEHPQVLVAGTAPDRNRGAAGVLVYQRVFHQPLYECSATFTVATGNDEAEVTAFIMIPVQRIRCL